MNIRQNFTQNDLYAELKCVMRAPKGLIGSAFCGICIVFAIMSFSIYRTQLYNVP